MWLLHDLYRIYTDLDEGQSVLGDLTLARVDEAGGIRPFVDEASSRLERAADRSRSSPTLDALSVVPVVGGQVDGLRNLVATVNDLGAELDQTAVRIDEQLSDAGGSPTGRVMVLETVLEEIDRLEVELEAIDVPDDPLLPPLNRARDELRKKLSSAGERLRDAEDYTSALHDLLVGPGKHLILAANNAEMTGGSGMPLAAGVAEISNGDIELGDFVQTRQLIGDEVVPLPPEYSELYHQMGLGRDFRGTTASPNFPVTGPILAEMSARSPLGEVESVFVVDAIALSHLLEVTGPIEIDGRELDADNVIAEVLNANYLRFETHREREQREDIQGRIAKRAFDALTERDVDIVSLVRTLASAAEGRHLLAWSSDPDLTSLWYQVGASGALAADGLMISVENYGANKLDWYLRPEATMTSTPRPGGGARVSLSVDLVNDGRGETSAYIEGPQPERHWVFLDVHLPWRASNITIETPGVDPYDRAVDSDRPMRVANIIYPIPRGAAQTAVVEFDLPAEQGPLVLLPSARVEPLPLSVGSRVVLDDKPTVFDWRSSLVGGRDPAPTAATIAAASLAVVAAWRMLVVSSTRHGRMLRISTTPDRLSMLLFAGAGCVLVVGTLVEQIAA